MTKFGQWAIPIKPKLTVRVWSNPLDFLPWTEVAYFLWFRTLRGAFLTVSSKTMTYTNSMYYIKTKLRNNAQCHNWSCKSFRTRKTPSMSQSSTLSEITKWADVKSKNSKMFTPPIATAFALFPSNQWTKNQNMNLTRMRFCLLRSTPNNRNNTELKEWTKFMISS